MWRLTVRSNARVCNGVPSVGRGGMEFAVGESEEGRLDLWLVPDRIHISRSGKGFERPSSGDTNGNTNRHLRVGLIDGRTSAT